MSRLQKAGELEEIRSVGKLMTLVRRRNSHSESGQTSKH